MSGLANPANNEYVFTVRQDEQNPAIVRDMPTSFTMNFRGTPDENGVVSVTKELNIGDLSFTELGDYKFAVREESSSDAENYPIDNNSEYYFYVSVRNKLDDDNQPTGEYIASLSSQTKNHDIGDKVDAVFRSVAVRSQIQVTNAVTGNLAKRDDYFKYKLEIVGAPVGDEYDIVGQDGVVDFAGESITTSNKIIVGQENYFYLRHGQVALIGSGGGRNILPIGLKYRVIEVNEDGYTRYVDGAEGNASTWKVVSGDSSSENNIVEFVNHKEGDVVTGIAMNTLPYLLAIGAVGGLVATWRVVSRKQKQTKCSR